jgi:hypothetical protein
MEGSMKRAIPVLLFGLFTIFVSGCGQSRQPAPVENLPVDATQVVETPDTTAVQVEAAPAMKALPAPWPQDFEVPAILELLTNETLADGSQQAELYIPDAVRGSANMFTVYDSLRVGNDNWLVPEDQGLDCWSTTMELNVPLTNGSQYILATGNWAAEDNTIHIILNLKNL